MSYPRCVGNFISHTDSEILDVLAFFTFNTCFSEFTKHQSNSEMQMYLLCILFVRSTCCFLSTRNPRRVARQIAVLIVVNVSAVRVIQCSYLDYQDSDLPALE